MLLGLDVGGTHTDAVIIYKNEIVASVKTVTDHNDLLKSTTAAIRQAVSAVDPGLIKSVNLSTTLSTNAIIENKTERVGVVVSSGPGIDAASFSIGKDYHVINGSIDHRGKEQSRLDLKELESALKNCSSNGCRVFAAVTKFSTRNPDHENKIRELAADSSDYTTAGHLLSGALSFPRRISTAYFNSAVWRVYNRFADSILASLKEIGITAPVNILKADGGTMPVSVSRLFPVESILSGPAASVMGIISLCEIKEDSFILDIGGTTSDIAVFAEGSPLIERSGIEINGCATLVRAIRTASFGIGGDSAVRFSDGVISVGPERQGPSMADGGTVPTLVDALNFAGHTSYALTERSVQGIEAMASRAAISPRALADGAVDFAVASIHSAMEAMLDKINSQPVYTIEEMLHQKKIEPSKLFIMGGPARGVSALLEKRLGIKTIVPDRYEVANAVGAAVARTTIDIELFADTGKGVLLVPNLKIRESVDSSYSLKDAEKDARRYLSAYLKKIGSDLPDSSIDIVQSSSFKMVNGYYSSGKDLRVRAQVRPDTAVRFNR